jgi:hypothetical protein
MIKKALAFLLVCAGIYVLENATAHYLVTINYIRTTTIQTVDPANWRLP